MSYAIDDGLIDGLEKAVALVGASQFTDARPHEYQKLRGLSECALHSIDADDLLSIATVELAGAVLDWLDGDDIEDRAALSRVMSAWETHIVMFAGTRFGIDPRDLLE